MFATIRRYEGVTDRTEELAKAMREVTSGLRSVPGFVSFVVIEAESGVLATFGIFEDQGSLDEAERLIRASIPNHLSMVLDEPAQVTTGEIIFQRGL